MGAPKWGVTALSHWGNRCAVAEAPVLLHEACIFGMSNEQVLCIIHLCSIFHVQEQESGFWSLLGEMVGVGGLSGKKKRLPALWLSKVNLFRSSLSGIQSLDACVCVRFTIWIYVCVSVWIPLHNVSWQWPSGQVLTRTFFFPTGFCSWIKDTLLY